MSEVHTGCGLCTPAFKIRDSQNLKVIADTAAGKKPQSVSRLLVRE